MSENSIQLENIVIRITKELLTKIPCLPINLCAMFVAKALGIDNVSQIIQILKRANYKKILYTFSIDGVNYYSKNKTINVYKYAGISKIIAEIVADYLPESVSFFVNLDSAMQASFPFKGKICQLCVYDGTAFGLEKIINDRTTSKEFKDIMVRIGVVKNKNDIAKLSGMGFISYYLTDDEMTFVQYLSTEEGDVWNKIDSL